MRINEILNYADKKFNNMLSGIINRPVAPPTNLTDLWVWATKNRKPYHRIFAHWARNEGLADVEHALDVLSTKSSEDLFSEKINEFKKLLNPNESLSREDYDRIKKYSKDVIESYQHIKSDWDADKDIPRDITTANGLINQIKRR